jgi:hypothetical protein
LATPPATGSVGTNNGRTSRSIRRTSVKAPNSSARSPTPTPTVSGQSDTSVKPWSRSKFTRYALSDHFRAGKISPVGTNHNRVSPFTVVVAGRVSTSLDIVVCWVVVCWVVADPADCWVDG